MRISWSFYTTWLHLISLIIRVLKSIATMMMIKESHCRWWYTELMNGIIDTAEDVRLLRERGIIVSYLKSDDAVAQLWNGMSRSIRLSRIDSMDKAIRDVNEYFNNKTRVKCIRFTKDCMFCCWKISMLLLTLVLLLLMAIQSFCQVYRCPRALGPVTEPGPSTNVRY